MKGLAWLALIVAIVALILGWVAYNRTGVDLEERIESAVEEAISEARMELEGGDAMMEEGVMMEDEGDTMMEDAE